MTRRSAAVLAAVLAAVALAGAGCAAGAGPAAAPAVQQRHPLPSSAPAPAGAAEPAASPASAGSAASAGDRGFRLNVPLPRARFVLTDAAGQRYDFASRTRGRATLLYFGYTHCPDQCPTMLADIAAALRQLPAAIRSRVAVVFVTTDPRRDTPAVLASYLAQFDRTFIGLTGDLADVVRAQQAAQIPVSRPTAERTRAAPSSTAHGGGALAYGLDDYAHLTYPAGTSVDDLVHDLPRLVAAAGAHG